MADTIFTKEYARLNREQKQAVDTIEGPVMVIAGPGTGKTQVLTLRIANILHTTDTNPQNILALTFTESATADMRRRLISLIGTQGYRVRIQTFHGFCSEVISQYPEYFPFGTDTTPASEIQTHGIMEKLLDNPKLTALRTPGSKYHYLKKILGSITTLKSEGIIPSRFRELVQAEVESFEQEKESLSKTARVKRESEIAKQLELVELYTLYQKELRTTGLIDFTDMIVHTVEALRKSETLRTLLQENLQYILVDEYQDTNGAQNTVVDHLASFWGESANVFVVGDPHQTIFRFQGASFENTLGFLTRYPQTQVITLRTGYRCPPDIYTAAHTVIGNNTSSQDLLQVLAENNPAVGTLVTGIAEPLVAHKRQTEHVISLATLPNQSEELTFIATQIQGQLASHVPAHDIAILVKTNEQATAVSTVLSQYEISHRVDRTINALTTEFGRQILTVFRTLVSLPSNTESVYLYNTLSAPWMNLPPLALMALTRAFAKQKIETSYVAFIQSGWSTIQAITGTTLSKDDYDLVRSQIDTLSKLSQFAESFAVPNWVASVYAELDIPQWVETQADTQSLIATLSAFHQFAQSNDTNDPSFSAHTFVELLGTMELQKLSLSISPDASSSQAVTIATVHKAKGKEWNSVYIPFLRDGIWAGGRTSSSITLPEGIIATQSKDDVLEDDRRLFYVALTRAKEKLFLSYPTTIIESGKVTDALPSQLLLELPQDLLSTVDTSTHDQKDSARHTLKPVLPQMFGEPEKLWIKSIVDDMALSVSALNTYLRDPKEFFENHILKIPQPVESHLAFGNAIHAALEQHYKNYKQKGNTHPDISLALAVFEEKLKKEVISRNDFESRSVQGKALLTDYLTQKGEQFPQVLAIEEGFGWKRGPILLDDIKLSGKVDRMDVIDEKQHLVHIIDYKTGKQKSENFIEGKIGLTEMSERERNLPESIRGAMKRQLLFYRLLLSRDPFYTQWTIAKATFDFVQSEKGKFVERSFTLSNDDVKLLEELIKEVMAEIRNLEFLKNL